MTNFNEKVKRGIGYILNSQEFFIYRTGTIKEFARMIHDDLYLLTNPYRMFIQYKTTHRDKKMAGRCFLWDYASATIDSVEVRSLNCDSNEDFSHFGYFGDPVFDSIEGAIFITDKYVVTYGDTWIEAVEISGEHVVCKAYVCGRFVSEFKIPSKTFDRIFGLKENFPKQYDEIFGQAKVPYAEPFDAQVEADEQADTETAQIVAETAPESTNEEDATECTICERITNKIVPDSYYKELFGFVFFDKRKCQEDIEDVKLLINYAIGLLRGVLCRLDDTQESVEKNAELSDDGCHLLRHSKVEMDVVRGMLLEMINNVENVELRARKYRRTDAKDRDLQ